MLKGRIGPERRPTAGRAPGCPRATDWLALVIHMYTKSLVDEVPNVSSRPYVDDITSDHTGSDVQLAVEIVGAICTFTDEFPADLSLKPNRVKSKPLTSVLPSIWCRGRRWLLPVRTWALPRHW